MKERACTIAMSALVVGLALGAACASKPKWSLDTPPADSGDMAGIKIDPQERDPSLYWDAVNQLSLYMAEQTVNLPRQFRKLTGRMHGSVNADVFGEVPNSSWFTNRHGVRRMTREELRRGPDQIAGPDTTGVWTIIRAKTQGVTPGFFVKDAAGETFVLKFDPLHYPELSTGAELVSTKLFHAFGYNVPENYLVEFDSKKLSIKDGMKYKDDHGQQRNFTPEVLADVLAKVETRSDGRIRATASRLLPGKPIGPFSYKGRRKDDPNDAVPHEHRRELRALKLFAELVNNFDTKDHNTLDVLVNVDGRKFVRHYLIDFSSTLGSDSDEPKSAYKGYAYALDVEQAIVSLVTLGLRRWSWEYADTSGMPPAVGYFESELFEPGGWKPLHPNPAFDNMLDEDAFWACRILGEFTRDDIRACVEAAEYSDPTATDYVVDQLWARRTKILNYVYGKVCPLDDFSVVDDGKGIAVSYVNRRVKDSLVDQRDIVYDAELRVRNSSILPELQLTDGRIELAHKDRATLAEVALSPAAKDETRVVQLNISETIAGARATATAFIYFDGDPSHTRLVGLSRDN